MKKTYISPSVEVIEVNAANIMAMSVFNNKEADSSTDQSGREANPFTHENIWDRAW